MATESDLRLAIRTVAVSARAAVTTHAKVGRPDLAAESARRGLKMLGDLEGRLTPETAADTRESFDSAMRELGAAAGQSDAEVEDDAARSEEVRSRP